MGFKALVVCAEGSEEASIAAGWAVTSRGAGATVSVCPPGFLASHSKTAAGTYDSVVVEGGEAVGADVLEEVTVRGTFNPGCIRCDAIFLLTCSYDRLKLLHCARSWSSSCLVATCCDRVSPLGWRVPRKTW